MDLLANNTITLTPQDAAVVYGALEVAHEAAQESLKFKQAERFRRAITTEIAAYMTLQTKLAIAFPELKVPAADVAS